MLPQLSSISSFSFLLRYSFLLDCKMLSPPLLALLLGGVSPKNWGPQLLLCTGIYLPTLTLWPFSVSPSPRLMGPNLTHPFCPYKQQASQLHSNPPMALQTQERPLSCLPWDLGAKECSDSLSGHQHRKGPSGLASIPSSSRPRSPSSFRAGWQQIYSHLYSSQ